jgi:hypothetical protein
MSKDDSNGDTVISFFFSVTTHVLREDLLRLALLVSQKSDSLGVAEICHYGTGNTIHFFLI